MNSLHGSNKRQSSLSRSKRGRLTKAIFREHRSDKLDKLDFVFFAHYDFVLSLAVELLLLPDFIKRLF